MFDGSGSTDPDGEVVHYRFDFGDGADSGWTSASQVDHAYSEAGLHEVILEVRDDDGNTSATNTTIWVRDGMPPIAALTVDPPTGEEGTAFSFSATLSFDPDGNILEYRWDFGDGTEGVGVEVEHRCRFMGLRSLYNAVIRFDNVKVPRENILLGEGKGLRVALTTLNTGRLTLPSACAGLSKRCLAIARKWSN